MMEKDTDGKYRSLDLMNTVNILRKIKEKCMATESCMDCPYHDMYSDRPWNCTIPVPPTFWNMNLWYDSAEKKPDISGRYLARYRTSTTQYKVVVLQYNALTGQWLDDYGNSVQQLLYEWQYLPSNYDLMTRRGTDE